MHRLIPIAVFLLLIGGVAAIIWKETGFAPPHEAAQSKKSNTPSTGATPPAVEKKADTGKKSPDSYSKRLQEELKKHIQPSKPATPPDTKTAEKKDGFWSWLPSLPSSGEEDCSVRNKTIDLTWQWRPLHEGGCIVVYHLNGQGEGEDGFGTFELDPSQDPYAVGRNPDRVRGRGKLKYSLCDSSLEGSPLRMNCSVLPARRSTATR